MDPILAQNVTSLGHFVPERILHRVKSGSVAVFGMIVAVLSLTGCMEVENDGQASTSESVKQIQTPEDSIDLLSFTVERETAIPGVKRSLDVRLQEKMDEDALQAIAVSLKSSDSDRYDRTFISYYLPDMEIGAGAWATSHFNPDLEVRILGLRAEDEAALSAGGVSDSRNVIGSWLDERAYVGSRISIFRESGKLYSERTFADGSDMKEEVREIMGRQGRRFDPVEGSDSGDRMIIDSQGNLRIEDDDGLIAVARKIN